MAVTLLETLDRTDLPKAYADLGDLYEEACLKAGEQLYQNGRPYEAARYFRLVANTRKTSRFMSSPCYTILGFWTARDGSVTSEFREDSTCDIAGETFTFLVPDSFTIMTERDGQMEATFRITYLTASRLDIRDMRTEGGPAYTFFRHTAESAESAEKTEKTEKTETSEKTEKPDQAGTSEAPGKTEGGEAAADDFSVEDGE